MLEQGNILIIDDNRYILDSLSLLLKQEFRRVNVLDTSDAVMAFLRSHQTDMVLLDMNFACVAHNGNKGLYWLKMIKDFDRDIIVVLMVVYGMEKQGIRAMHEGADDFIIKPWNSYKMVLNLKRLLRMRYFELELKQYRMFVDTIRNAGKHLLGEEVTTSGPGFTSHVDKSGALPGKSGVSFVKPKPLFDSDQAREVAERSMPLTLEEAERQTILRVFAMHRGNVSQTASSLAITRATLYAKLEKYGIRWPEINALVKSKQK